jgi:hypothetical protein
MTDKATPEVAAACAGLVLVDRELSAEGTTAARCAELWAEAQKLFAVLAGDVERAAEMLRAEQELAWVMPAELAVGPAVAEAIARAYAARVAGEPWEPRAGDELDRRAGRFLRMIAHPSCTAQEAGTAGNQVRYEALNGAVTV